MSFVDERGARRNRVAVLCPEDSSDRSVGSGTAFGLTRALEELGVDLVRVSGQPPRRTVGLVARGTRLRWRLTEGHVEDTWRRGIGATRTRNAAARLRLRQAGAVGGVVQLGSDFLIRVPEVPLVTYDDMTIRQAAAVDYAYWRLAGRDLRWRIDRQQAGYERAAACCTRSAWAAGSIVADYGIDAAKVKVVGVGRNHDIPIAPRRSWEQPTFLIVAKDWERKNGPRLLTAFAELRRHHPRARLHVVGGHPRIELPGVEAHGPLRLDDAAEKARLDELFGLATCFVMPSLHEPLGISYAEAGGAGIPSIGTVNGGAAEVIGPGGVVVDPEDERQIVAAMERFCDPAHAAAAGQRALEHARLYTWRRVAKRILNALGRLDPAEDPEATFLPGPQ